MNIRSAGRTPPVKGIAQGLQRAVTYCFTSPESMNIGGSASLETRDGRLVAVRTNFGTRVKATFKAAAGNPGCPSRERSEPGGALRDSIRSETGIVRRGESALGLLLRCERMVRFCHPR